MLKKLLVIIAVVLLLWCIISLDELDTRTYELKERYQELSVKHNKLTEIVRQIFENKNWSLYHR